MYDQFYGWDIHRFAQKALNDARFDARLHYHGYNDTGRWGVDLSTAPFLTTINPVERKIRLLNRFDPAAPRLPLLVVFGVPALLNWYPDQGARNGYDLNGSLHIEEKVQAIWDAGLSLRRGSQRPHRQRVAQARSKESPGVETGTHFRQSFIFTRNTPGAARWLFSTNTRAVAAH